MVDNHTGEPYDPVPGTLCASCISPLTTELSSTIISTLTLMIFSILSGVIYNWKTFYQSHLMIRVLITDREWYFYFGMLTSLWMDELLVIHIWRLGPIRVFCPPSLLMVLQRVLTNTLCCTILFAAFISENKYITRWLMWMPCMFQLCSLLNYYCDAFAREDICWSSFCSIIVLILCTINVVNIPYICCGKTRVPLGEEMDLYPVAPKKLETYMNEIAEDPSSVLHGTEYEEAIEMKTFDNDPIINEEEIYTSSSSSFVMSHVDIEITPSVTSSESEGENPFYEEITIETPKKFGRPYKPNKKRNEKKCDIK